ncbi:hypothetical protein EV424DRAFT_1558330 [Suillus variegatus]|nr:hypothetical protein EV424DRAFT_1558330 [Suillus variegatus]
MCRLSQVEQHSNELKIKQVDNSPSLNDKAEYCVLSFSTRLPAGSKVILFIGFSGELTRGQSYNGVLQELI